MAPKGTSVFMGLKEDLQKTTTYYGKIRNYTSPASELESFHVGRRGANQPAIKLQKKPTIAERIRAFPGGHGKGTEAIKGTERNP